MVDFSGPGADVSAAPGTYQASPAVPGDLGSGGAVGDTLRNAATDVGLAVGLYNGVKQALNGNGSAAPGALVSPNGTLPQHQTVYGIPVATFALGALILLAVGAVLILRKVRR